jgi:hypothetical protein
MNMPGFTAQTSLYRTSNNYRSPALGGASPQRTVLVPQLGGPGFEGLGNCLIDCADQHPDWTAARCRTSCRDPGGTPGSGPRYGPSCSVSEPAICGYAGWLACVAAFGPLGCAWVWGGIRDTCLENSQRECFIAQHGGLKGGSSYPRSVDVNKIPWSLQP